MYCTIPTPNTPNRGLDRGCYLKKGSSVLPLWVYFRKLTCVYVILRMVIATTPWNIPLKVSMPELPIICNFILAGGYKLMLFTFDLLNFLIMIRAVQWWRNLFSDHWLVERVNWNKCETFHINVLTAPQLCWMTADWSRAVVVATCIQLSSAPGPWTILNDRSSFSL